MSTRNETATPRAIVVGVDYSDLGDLAIERACEMSQSATPTELHVVNVVDAVVVPIDPGSATLAPSFEEASKQLYAHFENVVKRWCESRGAPLPFARLTTHVRSGNAAEAIAQLASDVEADLVIVGTHGRRGAKRFLLGSVAEGTVRLAPCAVLVVRPPTAAVPAIAPPCPRCVESRRASNGKEFWCEQHREHHERHHTYHYQQPKGSHQSGFLIHV